MQPVEDGVLARDATLGDRDELDAVGPPLLSASLHAGQGSSTRSSPTTLQRTARTGS
jgi:hypothetical protein